VGSKATLVRIYGALVGSIFDYSFFTVASVSDTSLKRIQSVQNRSIRCIYRLKWDSPTTDLPRISGLIPIRSRFIKLGGRYLTKCIIFKNELTSVLITEYVRSFSHKLFQYMFSLIKMIEEVKLKFTKGGFTRTHPHCFLYIQPI
jgi:hypothetical protein